MRHLICLFIIVIAGCEAHSFESDKRQITAKNEIRKQLRKANGFDITSFREDTVQTEVASTFNHPLRYALDFVYTDSTGKVVKNRGEVLFTPDGKSVISSHIVDQDKKLN